MFDSRKFRAALIMKGLSVEGLAKELGINASTLYRKINGISDFSRNEIQRIREIANFSSAELYAIFFAEELA